MMLGLWTNWNQPFINEMKKLDTGRMSIVEPLVVYVVLQKYGILNRNGRIPRISS
jgi:hypothetical protein